MLHPCYLKCGKKLRAEMAQLGADAIVTCTPGPNPSQYMYTGRCRHGRAYYVEPSAAQYDRWDAEGRPE